MTTIRDIITRAFRKIGVSGEGETLEAETLTEGLDAFNDMLQGWKLRGVDLRTEDFEANDTFDLGPEFREGCVYLLASRLSPNYEMPQGFDADDWFRTFQAAYMVIEPATFPRSLLKMPSAYMRGTRGGRIR